MNYVELTTRTSMMSWCDAAHILWDFETFMNGPIETTSYDKTIWSSKSMTTGGIIWFQAWFTKNVPVGSGTRLLQKSSLVKPFTLKNLFFLDKKKKFQRQDNQNVPVRHRTKLFSRNILAQLFYPNWSSIKSFKWKLYFIVRGTHLKTVFVLDQKVL